MSVKYNVDFRAKFIFYVLLLGCISAFKNNGTTQFIDKEILKKYLRLGDYFLEKFSVKVHNMTKNLERYNDETIGRSSLGKYYENWKPVLEDSEWTTRSKNKNRMQNKQNRRDSDGRNVKKLGMAMMPLVFHVGASSTWMLITAIMSFKAVALMTLLLIFKIAVAAAKVSSFFTHHYGHKEHATWSIPHQSYSSYEHDALGHRSFPDIHSFDPKTSQTSSGFQPIIGEHLEPFHPRHGEIIIKSEVEDLEDKLSLVKH